MKTAPPNTRHPKSGHGPAIRVRLAAVMAACILPLWIATGIQAYSSYQVRQAGLRDGVLNSAQVLSQGVGREVENIEAALRALATSPAFDSGDLATAHGQAAELLRFYPQSDIVVADSSGQQVINSYRPFGTPLPRRAARDSVRRVFETEAPVVSNLFFGAMTRRPLLSIDVPVQVGTKVKYDLAMTLPADRLGKILIEQRLPAEWVGQLVDETGTVIARTRDADTVVGQPVSAALRAAMARNRDGVFEDAARDGTRIIRAFSRSPTSGWTTVVDVPAALYHSELTRWLWSTVLGALVSSLAAVGLAMLIAGRILRANRNLEESEARFRAMADSSPAFIWLADRDGRRFWFNSTWHETLGSGPETSYGAGWLEGVHPDDRVRVRDIVDAAVHDRRIWRCEYRLYHPDGAVHWILETGAPRYAADKRLLGFIGSAIEINDRKETELELRRYSEIVETTGDFLAFIDRDYRYRLVNAAYAGMFSTTQDAIKGRLVEDVVGPELFAASRAALAATLAGTEQHQVAERVFPDGRQHMLDIDYRPFRVGDAVDGVVVSLQDITERLAAERELRIAAVAFETQEGIVIANSNGRIQRVNGAFCRISGFAAADVLGARPDLLLAARHDQAFLDAAVAALRRDGAWHGEVWSRRRDGQDYPVALTVSAVTDDKGEISHYVGAFQDITERKAAEEKILNLAFFDTLTGLPNRRLLLDRLHQALLAAERNQRHGALLFVDLDNFKTLNDTRGHDIGDLLLIEVARRLESCVRQTDTVARLGGDEFVLILEQLSETRAEAVEQAKRIGDKILADLNEPYCLKGIDHRSSPSIGVTLFRGNGQSDRELLKEADVAMYRAKAEGRNQLSFFATETESQSAAGDPA